ncbi:MAG: glycogen/starch/alpha-glucan phosphorylase [Deltaproteobacteria bacterium]|nr:glycogen/starch/alpha-glucan phosphorylase [Deltaproteobacteria bacterium]
MPTERNEIKLRDGQLKDAVQVVVEDDRTGMHPVTLERAVLDHLHYTCSKDEESATALDIFQAVAHAARDRLVHRWIETQRTYKEQDAKRIYYLSAEFLLGRSLGLNLINLGQYEVARKILMRYGVDLSRLLEQELDPGLGNGGLGRLAACFLDSMATLALPGNGYGIRYEFGIFAQGMRDGRQVEQADAWARFGNVWEMPRHEDTVSVKFYGREVQRTGRDGRLRTRWVDTRDVLAVPYDMPVAGYSNDTVNNLRLWSARASHDLDLAVFNDGDYRQAVEEKALTESISKVLYPKDDTPEGRELRLKQQYFFVRASICDIIRRFRTKHDDFGKFPDKVAIQLNDTHPSIAVAELMRVFVDEEDIDWETAWDLTQRTLAYTNHTLLPEALERWPVSLFERLLPRHLSIIYEINRRFMRYVHVVTGGDDEKKRRMSIIEEGPIQKIRMAHLAVVGSHSVNGVAELHTELIKKNLLPDFAELWPERFNNKTNGVTPRRWLLFCNPRLALAITERIGRAWICDLTELRKLTDFVNDETFGQQLRSIKRENKRRLAALIKSQHGFEPDLDSLFDVQIKRLHEYKRQLLNCLHIVSLYRQIRAKPDMDMVPRTFVFGGKAAPGYAMAKLHIKLINDVAAMVNDDPLVRGRIKVAFLANYGVSMAETIIPAADVSEQTSMAGMEASGTGNMKFTMNGALTVGTLDGANIEIRQEVGAENFFLFGRTAEQVEAIKRSGYRPSEMIEKSAALRGTIELIESGFFSPDEPDRFRPVTEHLRQTDTYLVCADFDDYAACQRRVEKAYRDPAAWTKMVILNLANSGKFSSDRTIAQYAKDIWGVKPVHIKLPELEETEERDGGSKDIVEQL